MVRVLIAIPTFENIYPDTYKALWDMDKGGHDVTFEFVRGYDCATARNKCAQLALDTGADYLMMVDNDVTVPADALVHLMEHGVDVVSGWYAHRDKVNGDTCRTNVCKTGEINYTMQYEGDELKRMARDGNVLVRIHGGGMGCILIKTEVFKRTTYPWYDWVNYNNANHTMLSEDLFFCEKCKGAGIKVYVDTRVGCGHLFRTIKTF